MDDFERGFHEELEKISKYISGHWVWTGGKDLPRWATKGKKPLQKFLTRELGVADDLAELVVKGVQKIKPKPSAKATGSNLRSAMAELL